MHHSRPFRLAPLALLLALALICASHAQTPLPLKTGQPGAAPNHRLILKDGTYQIVRKYEIAGDRVRYISVERGGDWEELPVALVDWEATRKWEQDMARAAVEEPSPAMKMAAELDREEAAARDEQKARRPEVAKGLQLPDEDAVFALDTFEGAPELVELTPVDLAMNARNRHGVNTLNPLSTSKARLELEGAHARVHLHDRALILYLALADSDKAEPLLSPALTVETLGNKEVANRKHGAHSSTSGFAIVRADERNTVRIVGTVHVSPSGKVTQSEDVIPATVEALPGEHWLRLSSQKPLGTGEYVLMEIISASEISQSVWEFRIDPESGDNPGSLGPILK